MLRTPDARLRAIAVPLIAVLLLIIGQLVRLQVVEHTRRQPEIEQVLRLPYTLPMPPSGTILDRNGDLLVGNLPIYDVGAQVNLIGNMTDTLKAATRLSTTTLGMSADELFNILDYTAPVGEEEEIAWKFLAKDVSPEVGAEIRALMDEGWWWLTLEPKWERYYAEGTLACYTLGFVNVYGEGYGIEGMQQRFLRPTTTDARGLVASWQEPLAEELALGKLRAYPGTDIVLTLDRTIQSFVEGELQRALLEFGAASGTILVMDPRTGAVLASASLPCYEPYALEQYPEDSDELFKDPAIIPYEPGSVLKVITLAAALDSGSVGLDWSYYDNGLLEYGGVPIYNSDGIGHGWQNLQGFLDASLNTGAATLTTQYLGADTFFSYIRAFGFGQATGIGVTNEERGIVHFPEDLEWSDSNLATNSFGQGISVTPIQLATAVSALANHGVMMAPYLVAERRYSDGRIVPTVPRRWSSTPPVSAATADLVAEMMAKTVDNRYTKAQIPGYRVAGKTGTAQIPIPGGYSESDVITSFIGFGPWPNPEVLILVKLDSPQNDPNLRWGTQTAAPVFKTVAERIFVLLGIPPTEVVAATQ